MLRLGLMLSFLAKPAMACKLALILSMDVSNSIDGGEFDCQARRVADGLLETEVMNVLVRDQVALTVVQWSGPDEQAVVIPWRRMLSEDEVRRFSNRVRVMRREFVFSKTAVGNAIDFTIPLFNSVSDC